MNQSWRRFRPSNLLLPKSWRLNFSSIFKILAIVIFVLILGVGSYFVYHYYTSRTTLLPDFGGTYIEGMAGQPKYINPVLSQTNDVDRDLVRLIFSAPLSFDRNHQVVGELAEKWDISADSKIYNITLKPNLIWHDGSPLTSEDVVFTYQLIQNPAYTGTLGQNWKDVTIEKVDDRTVRFTLKDSFSPFLVNLTTPILPKKALADKPIGSLEQLDYNSQPIGSGPFQVKKLKINRQGQYDSIELTRFDGYFGQKPYLDGITVKFYPDYQQLYRAYNSKEVMGISHVMTADWPTASSSFTTSSIFNIPLAQYTAVFFNQNSKELLRDPYVKEALYYATDRQDIVKQVLNDQGKVINTPILEGFVGHNPNIPGITRDVEKAKAVLEKGKWGDVDGDGTREKDNTRLIIKLVTSTNPEYIMTAKILQKQWQEVGIETNIVTANVGDLEKQYIKSRNYDCLLFGENLGYDPDPYFYWHSSQTADQGLNLSNYANVEIDRFLEAGRTSSDPEVRIHSYLPFQEVLFDDKPALFLYQPFYNYVVNQAIQGINIGNISNPADRFLYVNEWYLRTKRVFGSEKK